MVKESKKARKERQLLAHQEFIKDLKKSMQDCLKRKVQIDASKHFNYNDVVVTNY
jgi:biopolymer transport protein ExbD